MKLLLKSLKEFDKHREILDGASGEISPSVPKQAPQRFLRFPGESTEGVPRGVPERAYEEILRKIPRKSHKEF